MGQLSKDRVTEARPFCNVGVDYCGPFYTKEKRFRNRARVKIYVAVFVCLVVKAVHLEVVSDMTSEGFIAALRRFVARRGKPSIISSDNGSNFVGAKTEIEDIQRLLGSNEHNIKVHNFLLTKEIKWKFIPPSSPHFGGIWEAAVKSFKHHLRRILGNILLCFEDFNTLVIEIESILNSRPLTPLSSDPNDPLALTPGHFLIGEPITSLPEIDFSTTPSNRLSTWKHVQKLKRDFWSRWHKEYVNELNVRHKWNRGDHTVDVGSIVVIKTIIFHHYNGTWVASSQHIREQTASSGPSRLKRRLGPLIEALKNLHHCPLRILKGQSHLRAVKNSKPIM
ncbi:uncharacterized protein LOC124299393 [Neodiprion virginianus]|uniref:uncharacterized protein LOC124299393 n=1 Tax=Neodiprion virginianus TaxID=2961670 RepID=UPI001EE6FC0F|nr:uncharacterized protein LOC124299393 [Neodiprion virginianus]